MRDRRRDSARRRSSPYRWMDRDRRDSVGRDRLDVSGLFARSQFRPEWDSRRLDLGRGSAVARDWEEDIGGVRRQHYELVPSDVERRRGVGSSKRQREEERDDDEYDWKLSRLNKDVLSGEVYLNRSNLVDARLVESVPPGEILPRAFGGSLRSGEELYRSHESESSRLIGSRESGDFVQPTVSHCRRGEPEPSGSISSRVYNYSPSPERKVFRHDEGVQFALYGSRHRCDSVRQVIEPCRAGELMRNKVVFPAIKSEHCAVQYYEDSRKREPYVPTSPASGVGSSDVEFQQDKYIPVSLRSSCGFGGNASIRIDDRNLEYIGRNYASRVVCTRGIDGHLDRNSSRRSQKDERVESFHDSGYFPVLAEYDSGCHVSPSGTKRSKEMACEYSLVSDSAVEYVPGDSLTKNIGREADLFKHTRGPISKSSVTDSYVDKFDEADPVHGIYTRERTIDHYESVKVGSPFVQQKSRMVEDRDEEAYYFRKVHPGEKEGVHLDNRSQQLRQDCQFGVQARMYAGVDGSNMAVDLGERALQSRIVYLHEGRKAYLDDESQQLKKDHLFDSNTRMYADAGGLSELMLKHDDEALRFRRDHLNGTKLYLDDESVHLGKDKHFDLHTRTGHADGRRPVCSRDEILHSRENYGSILPVLDEQSHRAYKKMAQADDDCIRHMPMPFVDSEGGRFQDHGVAYDSRDKLYRDDYVMERISSEQCRYSITERRFDYDSHDHASSSCPRIPAKERLGGRVKDRNVNAKKRKEGSRKLLPWIRSIASNRKSLGRNHGNTS